jgi:hypothetical protein
MSLLANKLIGEAEDSLLRDVASYGIEIGLDKSFLARSGIVDLLGAEGVDSIEGLEINAVKRGEHGLEVCNDGDADQVGWSVYFWEINGPTQHIADFNTKSEAVSYLHRLWRAIGSPRVPVVSRDRTLEKDYDEK